MNSVGHRNTEQEDRSQMNSIHWGVLLKMNYFWFGKTVDAKHTTDSMASKCLGNIQYVTFQNRYFVEQNNYMLWSYINMLFYKNNWLAVR